MQNKTKKEEIMTRAASFLIAAALVGCGSIDEPKPTRPPTTQSSPVPLGGDLSGDYTLTGGGYIEIRRYPDYRHYSPIAKVYIVNRNGTKGVLRWTIEKSMAQIGDILYSSTIQSYSASDNVLGLLGQPLNGQLVTQLKISKKDGKLLLEMAITEKSNVIVFIGTVREL